MTILPHIMSLSAMLSNPRSFTDAAVSSTTYPIPIILKITRTTELDTPDACVNCLNSSMLCEK